MLEVLQNLFPHKEAEMAKARKDNKGRALKKGESQRTEDMRYVYTYTDPYGKRRYIYANDLRKTTYTNYKYMYDHFVREEFGKRKIGELKYSDVLYFYYHLLNEKHLQINTLETIHTVLHPTFQRVVYYPMDGAKKRRSVLQVSLPKTEAGIRVIPMMDAVYDAFKEEHEAQKENGFNCTEIDGMTGFVFCNRFGNVHNPQTINRTIRRISENYNAEEVLKAKLERRQLVILPHFSCHHLRHTFCTRFCEQETNIKVIQSIMGHANIETTMDIYAEVTDMKKTESMKNLAQKYDVF